MENLNIIKVAIFDWPYGTLTLLVVAMNLPCLSKFSIWSEFFYLKLIVCFFFVLCAWRLLRHACSRIVKIPRAKLIVATGIKSDCNETTSLYFLVSVWLKRTCIHTCCLPTMWIITIQTSHGLAMWHTEFSTFSRQAPLFTRNFSLANPVSYGPIPYA